MAQGESTEALTLHGVHAGVLGSSRVEGAREHVLCGMSGPGKVRCGPGGAPWPEKIRTRRGAHVGWERAAVLK